MAKIVDQTYNPPDWEDVPEAFQAKLAALDRLTDGELWQIARAVRTDVEMVRYDELLDRNAEFAEILEFLAALPTPEEILALRPSPALQEQIDRLATKHKAQDLTAREQLLWRQYEYLEHIVCMAKAKAYLKLD